MKQYPNNLKYKKFHKPSSGFRYLLADRNFFPFYGRYAIVSTESGKLTFKQIEAGRKSLKRAVKRLGFLWIRVFTYVSLSKKPLATRMGKGKGSHSKWVCPIRKGQTIYEISGLSDLKSYMVLCGAGSKLPVKTKIVKLIY